MKELILAVHRAVTQHYDRTKPWPVDFVKFTIHFDSRGRAVEISYTAIPEKCEDDLIESVRRVSEPHGKRFAGMLANVVVGFNNPSQN